MNLSDISKDIRDQVIADLKGLKLTDEELLLVNDASVRLAAYGTNLVGEPGYVEDLKAAADLSLATLENIGVAEGIKAASLARNAAFTVLTRFIGVALGAVAAA